MNGAMEDNRRLLAAARASKNVKTGNGVALKRLSRGDDLGVAGILSREVIQPLNMVVVGVVGVEPSAVCGTS